MEEGEGGGSILKYSDNITPLSCRPVGPIACPCVPCVDVSPAAPAPTRVGGGGEMEQLQMGGEARRKRGGGGMQRSIHKPRTGAFAQIVCAAFSQTRSSLGQQQEVSCCWFLRRAVRLQSACKKKKERRSEEEESRHTATYSCQHPGSKHGDQSVHSIVLRIHLGKGLKDLFVFDFMCGGVQHLVRLQKRRLNFLLNSLMSSLPVRRGKAYAAMSSWRVCTQIICFFLLSQLSVTLSPS